MDNGTFNQIVAIRTIRGFEVSSRAGVVREPCGGGQSDGCRAGTGYSATRDRDNGDQSSVATCGKCLDRTVFAFASPFLGFGAFGGGGRTFSSVHPH